MAVSFISGISDVANKFVKYDYSPEALTTTNFFSLPRELQLHIFSFFDKTELLQTLASVCKDWRKLSMDPSLWKHLSIDVLSEEETGKFALLLKRSVMLTKLRIQTSYSLEEFAGFSSACPKLKCLNLRWCPKLDERILALFVQNCPLIEELNVAACHIVKESVISITCLSHLRVLNLSLCVSVNDECIQLISEKCRHLEELNLSEIASITDKAFCNLKGNWNTTLLRLVLDAERLTDLAFSRISLFTELRLLSITDADRLTDQTLIYLKTLTNLQTLALHNSALMTTTALNDFFGGPHVHNLVELEMLGNRIDDDGVCNVTENCKLLRSLSLHQCYSVTEVAVGHIVKNCPNLIKLALTAMNHSVTGRSLRSLPENLTCLEVLDFSLCYGIDLSAIQELAIRVPRIKIQLPFDSESDTD